MSLAVTVDVIVLLSSLSDLQLQIGKRRHMLELDHGLMR